MSAANEGTPRTDAIVINGNAERFLSLCRMLERDLAAERAKREAAERELVKLDVIIRARIRELNAANERIKYHESERENLLLARDNHQQRAESAEARLKEALAAPIIGYAVWTDSVFEGALYTLSCQQEAFSAARRWNAWWCIQTDTPPIFALPAQPEQRQPAPAARASAGALGCPCRCRIGGLRWLSRRSRRVLRRWWISLAIASWLAAESIPTPTNSAQQVGAVAQY